MSSSVSLVATCSWDLKQQGENGACKFPLLRRMTPLQRAVLYAYLRIKETAQDPLVQRSLLEAPLFFTSSYGEIGPMSTLSEAVLDNETRLSPKDFQSSVLNAAPAYLCIAEERHGPLFAFSGGTWGAQRCAALALQLLISGQEHTALVIHAHQDSAHEGSSARAEILLLARHNPQEKMGAWILDSFFLNQRKTSKSDSVFYPKISTRPDLRERAQTQGLSENPQWLLDDKGNPKLTNEVETEKGESFGFRWKPKETGGGSSSEAVISVAANSEAATPEGDKPVSFRVAYPAVEQLLPHREPMLLIDRVLEHDPKTNSARVLCTLSKSKAFFDSQKTPKQVSLSKHWYLEIMAQSAAALAQLNWPLKLEGKPALGFILSIKQFSCTTEPAPHWDQDVICSCVFESWLEDVAGCKMNLEDSRGKELASAEMTFLSDSKGEFSSKVFS